MSPIKLVLGHIENSRIDLAIEVAESVFRTFAEFRTYCKEKANSMSEQILCCYTVPATPTWIHGYVRKKWNVSNDMAKQVIKHMPEICHTEEMEMEVRALYLEELKDPKCINELVCALARVHQLSCPIAEKIYEQYIDPRVSAILEKMKEAQAGGFEYAGLKFEHFMDRKVRKG